MSVSQPMTPVLCQVASYQILGENDEHTYIKIYMTTQGVSLSPFKDDDVSYFDEDYDQLVEVPTN